MRFIFELLKNPKWAKTHVKHKAIFGASLCRCVTETEKGTVKTTIKDEIPTCMDCRALMALLASFDYKMPSAVAMTIHQYVTFAHKQEKYHGVKIFGHK
jgi:hypothetical protein